MTVDHTTAVAPLAHPDRLFIDGRWVLPSTSSTFDVVDPATEELYFRAAEAQAADMSRAVDAARRAFDEGPWPHLTHAERAGYLRAMAEGLRARWADAAEVWPRESGVLHSIARATGQMAGGLFDLYASMADTFVFEQPVVPTMGGERGLLVREPVGVVGAIDPGMPRSARSPPRPPPPCSPDAPSWSSRRRRDRARGTSSPRSPRR